MKAKMVYAFEPDPVAFQILEKNASGYRIHVFQAAVSGYKGKITLGSGVLGASTTRKNLAAGGGIGEATETCEADCGTLRDLLELAGQGIKPFIKCDIEGSEEDIFLDPEFFRERKPTMLVELHPFWWKDEAKTWADFRAI